MLQEYRMTRPLSRLTKTDHILFNLSPQSPALYLPSKLFQRPPHHHL